MATHGVADAVEIGSHLLQRHGLVPDASLAPRLDDGKGRLKRVQRANGILQRPSQSAIPCLSALRLTLYDRVVEAMVRSPSPMRAAMKTIGRRDTCCIESAQTTLIRRVGLEFIYNGMWRALSRLKSLPT